MVHRMKNILILICRAQLAWYNRSGNIKNDTEKNENEKTNFSKSQHHFRSPCDPDRYIVCPEGHL
jgi:hypothetical protein